jgi:electron transfer flavoprotein alpha subunit
VLVDAPLAMDATAVAMDGGKVVATRPVYAGKAIQQLVLEAATVLVAIRPNIFAVGAAGKAGAIETVAASAVTPRTVVKEVKAAEQGALDVSEAAIVVSGGRGMKGPEHFHLIEELAKAFGNAAVGASRAVVDAGWRPHGERVGAEPARRSARSSTSPSASRGDPAPGGHAHGEGHRGDQQGQGRPIFKIADLRHRRRRIRDRAKLAEEIRRRRRLEPGLRPAP